MHYWIQRSIGRHVLPNIQCSIYGTVWRPFSARFKYTIGVPLTAYWTRQDSHKTSYKTKQGRAIKQQDKKPRDETRREAKRREHTTAMQSYLHHLESEVSIYWQQESDFSVSVAEFRPTVVNTNETQTVEGQGLRQRVRGDPYININPI